MFDAMSQEERAPFALENLSCSGDEASLLDCPVFLLSEEPAAALDYIFYYQSRVYEGSGTCDHATSTFAEVVCGVADAAGVYLCRACCHRPGVTPPARLIGGKMQSFKRA